MHLSPRPFALNNLPLPIRAERIQYRDQRLHTIEPVRRRDWPVGLPLRCGGERLQLRAQHVDRLELLDHQLVAQRLEFQTVRAADLGQTFSP